MGALPDTGKPHESETITALDAVSTSSLTSH
jgi:hypothetical protein